VELEQKLSLAIADGMSRAITSYSVMHGGLHLGVSQAVHDFLVAGGSTRCLGR
jgi:hypothetical protein